MMCVYRPLFSPSVSLTSKATVNTLVHSPLLTRSHNYLGRGSLGSRAVGEWVRVSGTGSRLWPSRAAVPITPVGRGPLSAAGTSC